MANTIISTVTTAGISLNTTGDTLTVMSSGAIISPTGTIYGGDTLNQTVMIDGLVNVSYLWLGGGNAVSITANGHFHGHSPSAIYLGSTSAGTTDFGNSVLINAGMIHGDLGAVQVFGVGNLIVNSGTITATEEGVATSYESLNRVVNTGEITSRYFIGVFLRGDNDTVDNSGHISAAGNGVEMIGIGQSLQNSGTISSSRSHAVQVTGVSSVIQNSAMMTADASAAIRYSSNTATAEVHKLVNLGLVAGATGVDAQGVNLRLVNHGSIDATGATGIKLSSTQIGAVSTITNTGTITAGSVAISGGDEQDFLYNTGTINGDINLGNGADWLDLRGGFVSGTVTGGSGSDTYLISDGAVTLVELFGNIGDIDTVRSTVSYQLEANFERLVLLGANDSTGTGNALFNTITGNAGNNLLLGLGGLDVVAGAAGDDTLLGGTSDDTLTGDDGDDLLRGGVGADSLNGGEGEDRLIGGAGRDVLTGSGGDDMFVFLALGDTGNTQVLADVITDFTQGTDIIDLSSIDAKTGTAGNEAFKFIKGAFTNAAGQLHAVASGGNTLVEYDRTGDGLADGVIVLNGLYTLTAADFVL
jgi:serralysin